MKQGNDDETFSGGTNEGISRTGAVELEVGLEAEKWARIEIGETRVRKKLGTRYSDIGLISRTLQADEYRFVDMIRLYL